MPSEAPILKSAIQPKPAVAEPRFVNAMRLSARQWLAVAGIVAVVLLATSPIWNKLERFEIGPDYRMPYTLSKDYWLYERRLQRLSPTNIVVLGDSVIWGEYVRSDGTLSHFLNQQSDTTSTNRAADSPSPPPRERAGVRGRFVNGGVNGLFPLAFE